jgi:hypothetical protein
MRNLRKYVVGCDGSPTEADRKEWLRFARSLSGDLSNCTEEDFPQIQQAVAGGARDMGFDEGDLDIKGLIDHLVLEQAEKLKLRKPEKPKT